MNNWSNQCYWMYEISHIPKANDNDEKKMTTISVEWKMRMEMNTKSQEDVSGGHTAGRWVDKRRRSINLMTVNQWEREIWKYPPIKKKKERAKCLRERERERGGGITELENERIQSLRTPLSLPHYVYVRLVNSFSSLTPIRFDVIDFFSLFFLTIYYLLYLLSISMLDYLICILSSFCSAYPISSNFDYFLLFFFGVCWGRRFDLNDWIRKCEDNAAN